MSNRVSKETKLVNFNLPVSLIDQIDSIGEGNRTSIVIDLLTQAVSMRQVDDTIKEFMYVEGKRQADDMGIDLYKNPSDIKNLIDGLWI